MRYLALLLLMTGTGLWVPPVMACDQTHTIVLTLTGPDDTAAPEGPSAVRAFRVPFAMADMAGPTVKVPDAVYEAFDTRIYGVKIQGVTLSAAAKALEESVGRRLHIDIGDGVAGDVKVTATFDGVTLGQALRLLAQSAGVTIQPVADTTAVRLVGAATTAEVRVERPGQPGVTTAEKTRTNPSAWSEEWGFVWPAVGYPSKRLPTPGQMGWIAARSATAGPMMAGTPELFKVEGTGGAPGEIRMHLQALEAAHGEMALSPEAMKEWEATTTMTMSPEAMKEWEAAMSEWAQAQPLHAEAMQRVQEELKKAQEALAHVRERHEGMPESQAAAEALERAMKELGQAHEAMAAHHAELERAMAAHREDLERAIAASTEATAHYQIETGPGGTMQVVAPAGVAAVSGDEIIFLPNATLQIDGKESGPVRVVLGRASGRPYLEVDGILRILKALPAGAHIVAIEVDKDNNRVIVKTDKQ